MLVNNNAYTLDRFEGDYAIFLKRPDETDQLLIHRAKIDVPVNEGDIVQILDDGENYQITVLQEQTEAQKEKVQNLLDRLKNQKN
ncbi:hypothetical protein BJ095_11397 [Ureibacillus chungkukjangi]|uniref:DUF3006 family protein n=1 Tax=Ureibacillus chungkukjangi TaxID=1202712 RepID=A0A318TMD9_9BACL|nr:DUF3006 domain-containing protein [Ureibacillus chungkukjangi]PYF06021.1 hypothetical protein BJ095_11397 [Ureibacillus chungkukjangi]